MDGVNLQFCSWQQEGIWHFAVTGINDAPVAKAVSVACQLPDTGMVQVIEDAYEPGAERSVVTGTLPTASARPSTHCMIESVKDWVPSNSGVSEE